MTVDPHESPLCFILEAVLSESEEDKAPEAEAQQSATSAWSSSKKSGEAGGYSSEASSEHGQHA